ncbi:hypothetical protein KMY75_29450, partial [Klebsiella quasipneumoniae]|nr:hypothetical protein [Klebsiella quasipneumoniae]
MLFVCVLCFHRDSFLDEWTSNLLTDHGSQTPVEEIVRGLSGEAVRILRKPDPAVVKPQLQALREKGYT